MVRLIARLKTKPGEEARVTEALRRLAVPSLAEPGCVRYEPYVVKGDQATLVVIETWADQAAFDTHAASAPFQEFLATVGKALDGPPDLAFLEEM